MLQRQVAFFACLVLSGSLLAQAAPPLRVGTFGGEIRSEENPGHFYFRNHLGEPDGLEHQILSYFAESLDRDLEVVWMEDFFELLPAVESGEIDIAAGTITVTPERDQLADFSRSYFPVRVVLVEPIGCDDDTGRRAFGKTSRQAVPASTLI